MSQIEFVVTRRCIPYFKKEVDGLPVGLVPYDVWSALCNQLTRINRPNNISAQKKFLPNTGWRVPLGFSQLEYQLGRMRFDAGNIPPLLHSHWFMIKYLSSSGVLHRSLLTSFVVKYDCFTCLIRCDVTYDTQFYCHDDESWHYI
jgi:hypothetical protein